MISQTSARGLVGASLLFLGSSTSAFGAGFALIEVNATGQGNAYAGAAAHTNNASTIFFNPAGMMELDGEQLVLALHYIAPSSDFSNEGSAMAPGAGGADLIGPDDDGGRSAFVPNFYWVKPLESGMTFGLGLNAPFGLATEYDDDWVGRYHALLSDLQTINVNPSLGRRVNDKLSIGGGLNFLLAKVELSSAIDIGTLTATTPQTNDGKAELDGDNFSDIALGFNLGLLYKISERTNLGVAYRSEIDVDVSGEADFTIPAPFDAVLAPAFTDTDINAEVTLPASFSVSLAHRVEKITWLADVTWTGWSSFDELRIEYDNPAQSDSVTTEDWDDTLRYSVGLDYQYSDRMVLRTGIAYDETPVPSEERRTPRVPDTDRTWLSFGMTYRVDNELSFELGYSHLFIDDADINNTLEIEPPAGTALNATLTGEYEADVDIFSAQLNWRID